MMHPDGTVHFSDLKAFALSPAHYREKVTHGTTTTPAMRHGTLVDMLLLTDREPIVAGEDRRSKAYQAARAAYPADVEVFTEAEMDRALDIVRTVQADERARDFLGLDDPERRTQIPLRWTFQGVPMSTRGLDVVTRKRLVDLKVTQTTQPDRLLFQARRMAWHAQLAAYQEAAAQNGIDVSGGAFLCCVESKAPYPVVVLSVNESALEEGRKMLSTWIETFKACAAEDTWPGYVQSPVDFDVFGGDLDGLVFPDDEAA